MCLQSDRWKLFRSSSLLNAMLARPSAAAVEFHVSPTRVGGILIDWEDDVTEHEMELSPDGSVGCLHHNKGTGKIATRKFSASDRAVVDPGLLHELRELLPAA